MASPRGFEPLKTSRLVDVACVILASRYRFLANFTHQFLALLLPSLMLETHTNRIQFEHKFLRLTSKEAKTPYDE